MRTNDDSPAIREFPFPGKVNFIPVNTNWGLEGSFSGYFVWLEVMTLLEMMAENDLNLRFNIEILPRFDSPHHLVVLSHRSKVESHVVKDHALMVQVLVSFDVICGKSHHITWSEGMHFYRIAGDGVILEKGEISEGG